MKILVLSEAYPSKDNAYAMSYVHSRCKYYKAMGIDVDVISFMSTGNYNFEGIDVYDEKNYNIKKQNIDIIFSHAPNLKNHIRILLKKEYYKVPLIFFFHGHEVMKINTYYPKAYEFDMKDKINKLINNFYDPIKLFILKKYILSKINTNSIHLIFVSKWMMDTAYHSLELKQKEIHDFNAISTIIHNSINQVFLKKQYNKNIKKIADFITIRPFDDPKYAMDVIYEIAENNPKYSFHVYGKGRFFSNKKTLDNLIIFNEFILQKDIPDLLNKYKYALMPTKLDAQGVMMCEFATYGIPLITSDLDICHEMLNGFKNVVYISNSLDKKLDLDAVVSKLEINSLRVKKFDGYILAREEVDIAKKIVGKNK